MFIVFLSLIITLFVFTCICKEVVYLCIVAAILGLALVLIVTSPQTASRTVLMHTYLHSLARTYHLAFIGRLLCKTLPVTKLHIWRLEVPLFLLALDQWRLLRIFNNVFVT